MTIENQIEQTETQQETPKKTLTKTQKNNRRLIKLLEERYPKTFNWNDPQPLKIGIDKEIATDEELTESKLKRALAAYTHSNRYKKCLKVHSHRVDLQGNKEKAKPQDKKQGKAPQKRSQPVKNKKTDSKKKPQDKYANYSAEERMKMKLEQLVGTKK